MAISALPSFVRLFIILYSKNGRNFFLSDSSTLMTDLFRNLILDCKISQHINISFRNTGEIIKQKINYKLQSKSTHNLVKSSL